MANPYMEERHDEDTDTCWWFCRACSATGTSFFSTINMRLEAREHARTCREARSAV